MICSCGFVFSVFVIGFFFFFSSRRRHTRWPRDWSSDVCSSDLFGRIAILRIGMRPNGSPGDVEVFARGATDADPGLLRGADALRSEERRVGKECRARWSAEH